MARVTRLFIATLCLILIASHVQSEVIDKIVAVVNGDVITLSLLGNQLRTGDYSLYRESTQRQRMALEDLIEWKLMLQEAERYGKGVVVEEEIRKERERRISQLPPGVSFEEVMQQLGLTIDYVNENIREHIMIAQMSYSKFFSNEPVSDEEAAEYHDEHRSRFVETWIEWEGVYLSMDPSIPASQRRTIREHAQSIRNSLRRSTLEAVSQWLGEDSRVSIVRNEQPVLLESHIPALGNAFRRLELAQWSHVIETPIGFFVVRLLNRQEPHPQELEQVMPAIKKLLRTQRIQLRRRDWLNRVKEEADIRILDPILESTSVNPQTTGLPPHGNP